MTIFEQLDRFEITPVFPGEDADRLARGFTDKVRKALLGALPQCDTELQVERFDCPYCGVAKGRRAMQIDHIIPRGLYMKYQAMKQHEALLPYLQRGTTEIHAFLADQAKDSSNLVLSCAHCNLGKSDRLYSPEKFREIAGRIDAGNAVRAKMLRASEISAEMDEVLIENPHLHTFIVREHTWNLRRPPPYSLYSPTLHRAGPARDVDETLLWQIDTLVNVVGNFMIKWIPQTPQERWDELHSAQVRIVKQHLRGYLCLYCLGLHDDDAFEIDHIRPQPIPERRTVATNNEGGNLIAVCKSCNASKGDRYRIARDFFPKRAAQRAGKRITGIESLRNPGTSVDDALRVAHRRQFQVFEGHVEARPHTLLPGSFDWWMNAEIEDAPT